MSLAVALCGAGAGLSQDRSGAVGKRAFAIEPQPLGRAIVSFSKAAGVDVIGDGGVVSGARSGRAVGVMTPDEALERITAGTGASYRFTDATTVALQAPQVEPMQQETAVPLQEINVEGQGGGAGESAFGPVDGYVATRSATGSKTDAPLIEVPQAINVVTADQIKAQGAQTVSEALRYTPGVRGEGYGVSAPFDVYTLVRGFRADLYLDGLRLPKGGVNGWSSSVVDPWALERLEVLKGPASGLYGQSGPGGVINMVSKRPTETPVREVQVQGGGFDRLQGAFDFGGPIEGSDELSYRITGLARDAGNQIDHAKEERVFIAPAVTWRPSDDTSLTVLGSYQRERGVWPFYNYLPAAGTLYKVNGRRISTGLYIGEPDLDRLKREQSSVGYEFQHRFNEIFSVKQNLRFSRSDFDARAVATGTAFPSPDGTLERSGLHMSTKTDVFALDNQVRVEFATGALAHDVVAGVDYRRESNDQLFTEGAAPSINLYNPIYGTGPVSFNDYTIMDFNSKLEQVGVYAQDQIKLGRWVATLGGRYDWTDSNLDSVFSKAPVKRKDGAFTGRAGLTYLFDGGLAPYVSYATSFQPETGVDSAVQRPFKPSRGEQLEAGVKYQPAGMNALITVAAFDLRQTNVVTSDRLFVERQIGEVRVKGVEVEGKGEVFENFNVIASFAYLDHEIAKSANPEEVGRKLFSTPNHQAALWGDYAFTSGVLSGFGFGAGVRYMGSTTDSENVLKVPGVTLFDGQLKLDLARFAPRLAGATLALNATNLLDKKYVSQCDGAPMCTYGSRRAVLATLNYKW